MSVGDKGDFYHAQSENAVVGILEVTAEAHPDSTTDDDRWLCVDIKVVGPFARPVTRAEIKADLALSDMVLVRNTRRSVQPVTRDQWHRICALGKTPPD